MKTQAVLKNDYISLKTSAICNSNIYKLDIFLSCFALFRIFISKNKKEIITLMYNCKSDDITHCDCKEDSNIINFLPYFTHISKRKYMLVHGL